MQKVIALFLIFNCSLLLGQQTDFKHIDFKKADSIAKKVKSKRLFELNKLTVELTKNLHTDIEKVRVIYKWICLNIANDFRLFEKNERKRRKYKNDSIQLANWNSELKKELFKRLLKRKRTICTGYAYLFKEMCNIIDISCKMVYGFGKTVDFLDFDPSLPNHTWNIVKIDKKWYLCDATWAAGISNAEEGVFQFSYNNGYFLTEPKLFFFNHFPIKPEYSLLEKTPNFQEFIDAPLLYGEAYKILKNHISPKKMFQTIELNSTIPFTYEFKENKDIQYKLKFRIANGSSEKTYYPTHQKSKNTTTLHYTFKKVGLFDVHLYLEDKIVATYVFKVINHEN